jgi:hypothetical protein
VTQRVSTGWHIRFPIEGTQHPQASYMSPAWEVSVMSLHMGWHRAVQIFCGDYPGKTRETTQFGFDRGQGGISPCLILWRGACPGWLSTPNGDLGSTQILTRQYSVQSQTVSQLVSSETTPSSKSMEVSSSRLLKHLRIGSVQMPHHILTTQTKLRVYIKVVSTKTHRTYVT